MLSTTRGIFEAFGGTNAVARRARCSSAAAAQWRSKGVPPSRRILLNYLARYRGVEIDQTWLWGDLPMAWWHRIAKEPPPENRAKVYNDGQLFAAIGNGKRIADLCSATPATLSNWRKRGVPAQRRIFFHMAAPHMGINLDSQWIWAELPEGWLGR